ncbi:MAG: ribonuclease III [Clostridium sp.]|nr:ribonuclease III [Clostridium sp.]
MFPSEIIERIRLPFRKDKELYSSFYKILGFYPRNIDLYKQALLHKSSSVRGEQGRWMNNERLEFLGDAVLDSIVGDIVYRHFEGKREGFLTNTRSKIVQRESLNRIAVEIGLDKLIKSSTHSSAHNSYMCGNAFEALVGAVYLDRGYDYCMRFMSRRILQSLVNIDKVAYKEVNFKSKLIEWGQKNRVNVEFRLLEQTMEGNSAPVFNTEVVIEGIACGTGKGYSKKESQQLAAKVTLTQLKKKSKLQAEIFARKGERTAQEEEPVTAVPDVTGTPVLTEVAAEGNSGESAGKKRRGDRRSKPVAGEDPAVRTAKQAEELPSVAAVKPVKETAQPAEAPKKGKEETPVREQKSARGEKRNARKDRLEEQKAACDPKPARERKPSADKAGSDGAKRSKSPRGKSVREKDSAEGTVVFRDPKPVYAPKPVVPEADEMDLSDIRVNTKAPERDDIIAAAEEEAWKQLQQS